MTVAGAMIFLTVIPGVGAAIGSAEIAASKAV
jgi:hypothetical protein